LIAFAANSVLCRMALGHEMIDAALLILGGIALVVRGKHS